MELMLYTVALMMFLVEDIGTGALEATRQEHRPCVSILTYQEMKQMGSRAVQAEHPYMCL